MLDTAAAGEVGQATTGVATVVPGINARGGSLNREISQQLFLDAESALAYHIPLT